MSSSEQNKESHNQLDDVEIANLNSQFAQYSQSDLIKANDEMLNAIHEDASVNPLIASALTPLSVLKTEFDSGTAFQDQLDHLQKLGFAAARKVRGDGDCFYRSFAYSYLEQLFYEQDIEIAVLKRISFLDNLESRLRSAGFEKESYEDFQDVFKDTILNFIQPDEQGRTMNRQKLIELFQDSMKNYSIVFYLRLITSMRIFEESENVAPFLMNPETYDPMSPTGFRRRQIEVMGVEADEPQIDALTNVMKVNVEVAYLDGHPTPEIVRFVKIDRSDSQDGGNTNRPIQLLYRPGHYDVLVRK